MSELIRYEPNDHQSSGLRAVEPKIPGVGVRLAVPGDFDWIDRLQKAESDKVGFLWEAAIRKRIDEGNVIVAEAAASPEACGLSGEGEAGAVDLKSRASSLTPAPAGYCLGVDRYMKQDHVGIIYQMCVAPQYRRSLVAATLLQAQFDKSAYGTKLYCCWCKQSLEANRFWEAMGFVPLAFRAAGRSTLEKLQKREGSTSGGVHVFWQKRVRAGDHETPYWYPYETSGGAMMEGRVVLPLPAEVQWHEATPVVLPGAERRAEEERLLEDKLSAVKQKERAAKKRNGGKGAGESGGPFPGLPGAGAGAGAGAPRAVGTGGFGAGSGFGEPPPESSEAAAKSKALLTPDDAELARIEAEKAAAKKALKAAQRKNDPELVAYARELRDRWQEHVAPDGPGAGMIESKQRGRYAVGRLLGAAANADAQPIRVVGNDHEPKQLPSAA